MEKMVDYKISHLTTMILEKLHIYLIINIPKWNLQNK